MKGAIFTIISLIISLSLSCSQPSEYGGSFKIDRGDCSSEYITLKRVQGFGDKYYLVTIYRNEASGKGKEFLGVIKQNVITIDTSSITVKSDSLQVISGDKDCIYKKVD